MRILPGDVATVILSGSGEGTVSPEARTALRDELGLNDSLISQYLDWLINMLNGSFGGKSLESRESLGSIIGRQIPVTFLLTIYSLVLAISISIPLGIYSAIKNGRPPDIVIRIISLTGLGMPNLWLAILLILGLLILFGWSPPITYSSPWSNFLLHSQMLIWPAIILAWEQSSHLIRIIRSNMLNILDQDYILTAKSLGLSETAIIVGHALPNAFVSTLTVIGLQFGTLISGVVVLETIFGLPGIGRTLIQAALVRDYPVIQSLATLMVFFSLLINLLIDIAYQYFDPRLQSWNLRD